MKRLHDLITGSVCYRIAYAIALVGAVAHETIAFTCDVIPLLLEDGIELLRHDARLVCLWVWR